MLHLKGGFAGPFFWMAGLPGDTLKSKWQTDLEGKYKSLRDVVMRTNTIKQLYKGFKPVMVRSFPANAVCFLTYEYAYKKINDFC